MSTPVFTTPTLHALRSACGPTPRTTELGSSKSSDRLATFSSSGCRQVSLLTPNGREARLSIAVSAGPTGVPACAAGACQSRRSRRVLGASSRSATATSPDQAGIGRSCRTEGHHEGRLRVADDPGPQPSTLEISVTLGVEPQLDVGDSVAEHPGADLDGSRSAMWVTTSPGVKGRFRDPDTSADLVDGEEDRGDGAIGHCSVLPTVEAASQGERVCAARDARPLTSPRCAPRHEPTERGRPSAAPGVGGRDSACCPRRLPWADAACGVRCRGSGLSLAARPGP